MGTTFRVVLYARNQVAADRAFERAFRRIAGLDDDAERLPRLV